MDAAVHHPKSYYTDSDAALTDAQLDKIAKDLDLGRWNFYGALYVGQPCQSYLYPILIRRVMVRDRSPSATFFGR